MTELISSAATHTALAATVAEAEAHHSQARAAATLRAYRADWRAFAAWCATHGVRTTLEQKVALRKFITIGG